MTGINEGGPYKSATFLYLAKGPHRRLLERRSHDAKPGG